MASAQPIEVDFTRGLKRVLFAGGVQWGRRLNKCSINGEWWMMRVLLITDDFGVFPADPTRCLHEAAPLRRDISTAHVLAWLEELEKNGLILRYEAAGEVWGVFVKAPEQPKHGRRYRRYPAPPPSQEPVLERTMAPSSDAPKASNDEPPGFLKFWTAWPRHPRKNDRSRCLAKWIGRELETIADKVLAGVEAAKGSRDWTKDDGAYIPAPLVWLNGSRWEGVLDAANAAQEQEASLLPTTEEVDAAWRNAGGEGGQP